MSYLRRIKMGGDRDWPWNFRESLLKSVMTKSWSPSGKKSVLGQGKHWCQSSNVRLNWMFSRNRNKADMSRTSWERERCEMKQGQFLSGNQGEEWGFYFKCNGKPLKSFKLLERKQSYRKGWSWQMDRKRT